MEVAAVWIRCPGIPEKACLAHLNACVPDYGPKASIQFQDIFFTNKKSKGSFKNFFSQISL